jgi:3'(2'), 5'-bisphosphate nucleotidase
VTGLADRDGLVTDVLAIARRASAVVMRVYAAPFDVDFKAKDDPVTLADREANALICAALQAEFPGVPVVAEESDPASYAGYGSAPAVWFVDPLDGTRDFVRRNGEFAVMIGLAEGGEPTVGVVVCPAVGRAFVGAKGLGAFEVAEDGSRRRIHTSGAATLGEAELIVSRSKRSGALEERAHELGFRKLTRCGSAGVKGTRIATGEADVYAQPGRAGALWDTCAPEALVRAAGGRVTDGSGRVIDYATRELPNAHGFVASNGPIHDEVLALIARLGPPLPGPGRAV